VNTTVVDLILCLDGRRQRR